MTSPRRYLVRMLIFLALVAGVVAALHGELWPAFLTNPVLNGLILVVALIGVAWTLRQVLALGPEVAWLERFRAAPGEPPTGPTPRLLGPLARMLAGRRGERLSLSAPAMRSVLDGLAAALDEGREISRYITGLLIFLGLLGTFWGLLLTIGSVSEVIGGMSVGTGDLGQLFGQLKSGLAQPLKGMGTAFSASMFGLIGSIMLGFQMVIVKRTCTAMVDHVREQLLALAEKASGGGQVELTERFLATLMADMMEQHRQTGDTLSQLVNRLSDFAPRLERAVEVNERLAVQFDGYAEALVRTTSAVSLVRDVVPMMTHLADHSAQLMSEVGSARVAMDAVIKSVPDLQSMRGDMMVTLAAIADLGQSIKETRELTGALSTEVARQTDVSERLDAALSNAERERLTELRLKPTVGATIKASIKRMLDDDDQRNAS